MKPNSDPPSAHKTLPQSPWPVETPRPVLPRKPASRLIFSPLAWLKLMFFLHAGDTEIGGFAISAEDNPLYIEQFVTVEQAVSSVTVEFADDAVADYFDRCVDAGLKPERFARIWCHTHPGESPTPSGTDEQTFARVFGPCEWSVMFIIGRTGLTYARLAFAAGPGAHVLLPVAVDWSAWPEEILAAQLGGMTAEWAKEYDTHVHPLPLFEFGHFGGIHTEVGNAGIREMDIRDIDVQDIDAQNWEDQELGGWWDLEDYQPRYPSRDSEIGVGS